MKQLITHLTTTTPWAAYCRSFATARLCGALLLSALSLNSQAQQRAVPTLFRDDAAAQTAARTAPLNALLYRARPVSLELSSLRTALAAAPLERPGAQPITLALPLPDGRTGRFAVYEAPVMAPALAARHPEIRTYAGRGLDDATATVRLDVMPTGFHAQVLSADEGPVYIEPMSASDTGHYLSLRLADARPQQNSSGCAGAAYPPASSSPVLIPRGTAGATGPQSRQLPVGSQLRTLRLAVATTDEYTALCGGPALALSHIISTVNRVTGVYERELAVRLELIPNEELLIAANSASSPDPFSNNNHWTTAPAENQTFIDRVIGSAYYDIGHVFGTYTASYAYIGVVCESWKARGESGSFSPAGDFFNIRTVAHEMGHQLGASHSFNSANAGSCTTNYRMGSAAYEPGSGTTIMSYAGLCPPDNIANEPSPYFHTDSYQTIQLNLNSLGCGTMAATGNTPPVVTGPASGDKVLPISTPFKLTASGTDANNDALTYCWEQMDKGISDSPSSPQAVGQTPPLFRSWPASSSPTRYFPALPTLLANTSSPAERLPTVARPLTFVCTARDAHNGPLGVVGGVAQTTDLALRVTANAGPFLVTAPNAAVNWASGSTQTVTWNVAGTDANDVDCTSVNLRLSTDGGYTYPIILLANTPNDGNQAITVPNLATTTARIMVEAVGNYFFDISNANFTITASPTAPVLSSLSPASGAVGSTISVTGSNLTGLSTVTVGGVSATFAGVSATGFSFVVPAGAPAGPVLATTANGASNGLAFTVLPAISSFTPASGTAGSLITITGTSLSEITALRFNGTAATSFSSNAAGTQLTATVPTGATTGLITLTTPAGTASSATNFTVLPTPCTAPTGLTFRQIGSSSVTVLFATSAGAQSYTVSTTPASTTQTVNSGYAVLTGLTGNTAYTLNIVSNCAGGQTSAAAMASFSTAPATLNNECASAVVLTPGAPGADCSPTGGTVAGATQSQAPNTCNSSRPATARDVWYRFTATSDAHILSVRSSFVGVIELFNGNCAGLTSRTCANANQRIGEVTSLSMTGLTVGTTYWARFYASSSSVPSQPEFFICVTTRALGCQAPTNLAVINPSTSTGRLDFTGSPTAIDYTITTVPYSTPVTTSLTSLNLINLQYGTTYTVTVTSNCSGGVTAAASTTFTTETPPPCTPPTEVLISEVTMTDALLSFAANPNYNYVRVSTVPATINLYTTANPIRLTGLTPGTTYTVSVELQCAPMGPATPVSTTFTTLPPPCTAATSLSVGNVTSSSATVSFTPSAQATSYVVTTTPASTTQTITASPVTLSGLQAARSYTVTIASTCSSGAAEATASFTTPYPDLTVSTTTTIPAGIYNNITITGTGDATAAGNVGVQGVLRVQAGGAFHDDCRIINGPGSFVLEAGATLYICSALGIVRDGSSGAIRLTGGLSFSEYASYVYKGFAPQVTGSGLPAQVFSLTADGVGPVRLSKSVSISRVMQLYNTDIILSNSNLTLLSNASGTAYAVNAGTGQVLNNGTGRATMQRYVRPSTNYRGPGYRHYSSPVSGATVASLTLPGSFVPLVNAAYNALPTPALPVAQFPTVFGYDQSRLTASYPGFDVGWYSPAALTDALQPSRAYTVNLRPSDTLSLTGLLNTGFIGTGPLRRGVGPDAGWHLLGNPYPAPLDWHLVETTPGALPAGLSNAIYVYEPDAQYSGFYRSFTNNIGTLGFDGVVPAMQGFFVRTTSDVPGGFDFQNAFRLTTYRNPAFHRSAGPDADAAGRPLLRLQLSGASPEPDETVLYLERGATATGTDARFDAPKVPNAGSVPSLASQMPGAGNEPLAINGLPPLGAASSAVRVPLRLTLPAAGPYELSAASLTDFDPALPVLLLDLATGQTTDLRQQPMYAFTATQAGALNQRFELWLGRPTGALATSAAASTSFSLWPNPVRGKAQLHLALDRPATTATATLSDVLGRPVVQHSFGGSATELSTNGLTPGTYLLRVQVKGQAATTRRVVIE
ncbi:M12 family metallo-peptidase [Hymenobacter sp. ASUV-10]|uniref:M12 family metallo-peptidase n=1 Tax=Hymenobacter aranciens TaxID=3063996 RepID=A0ABT9B8X6_9BACT|nr:M12 family metallo-peptidase [Hymenobacter sp. ASUV-10]MDO7874711.1 M12 family metallo-peptidase [Hymenobacter sp. ASUV-10]